MNLIKKLSLALASSLPLLLAGVSFAEDGTTITPASPTVTTLVDTTGLGNSLLSGMQSWLMIGLGVGISLFIIMVGWRWLRRFVR